MSSRCRSAERALLALGLLLAGCEAEKREFEAPRSPSAPRADTVRTSELQPGKPLLADDRRGRHFEGNAYHISEGSRLFRWFNCNGCHANGGGAIGPALMDAEWRYGGTIEQVHASIIQGRPNGMPAFAGKVTDDQAWQLAAYVRALSSNVPLYVKPGGRNGMAATEAPSQMSEQEPKTSESGQ